MKLKNKISGGLATLVENEDCLTLKTDAGFHHYFSLAQLNKEWEDYEEPQEYWYVDEDGEVWHHEVGKCEDMVARKSIGNYFETKEKAEKAVEKLKAWKRLKDKGFRFNDWKCTGSISFTFDNYYGDGQPKSASDDLDLLFGGEE